MKAIVLSGGGSKGAFQAGALKYILNHTNERYDIITGTSVGALNAVFLAQYDPDPKVNKQAAAGLEKLWKNVDNDKVYKKWNFFGKLNFFGKKSLYDNSPLRKMVEDNVDLDKLANSNRKLVVKSVCLNDGSCRATAIPLAFQPVNVKDNEYDYDGGVRDVTPLKAAIDAGATDITIISARALSMGKRKPKEMNVFEYLSRVISIMVNEIFMNDVNKFISINELVKQGKITDKRYITYKFIYPKKKKLLSSSLDFNPDGIQTMFDYGYERAKEILTADD